MTEYHFDGHPAIDSTRRHLERVLRAPTPLVYHNPAVGLTPHPPDQLH
jgi:hypothetical protein